MKTTQEVFKETLEELGFANRKPSQMTNSDYWLCTTTAMEKYAERFKSRAERHEKLENELWDAYEENDLCVMGEIVVAHFGIE